MFEGRTTTWLLDELLVHPCARYVGIDIAPPPALRANLNKFAFARAAPGGASAGDVDDDDGSDLRSVRGLEHVTLLFEPSETALPQLLRARDDAVAAVAAASASSSSTSSAAQACATAEEDDEAAAAVAEGCVDSTLNVVVIALVVAHQRSVCATPHHPYHQVRLRIR